MGKRSQSKGGRREREAVKLLEKFGWRARRQPYSGAKQDWPHDLQARIELPDGTSHDLNVEVKARANGGGFTQLERWKADADVLMLRRDNAPWLFCFDEHTLQQLVDTLARREAVARDAAADGAHASHPEDVRRTPRRLGQGVDRPKHRWPKRKLQSRGWR